MPRIWYSRIETDGATVSLSVRSDGDWDFSEYAEFGKYYQSREPFGAYTGNFKPAFLEPDEASARIKLTYADAFSATDRMLIVSKRFRDVLARFDLGQTRLIKLRLTEFRGPPTDDPPYYLLHLAEAKSTLVPEESEGIDQMEFRNNPTKKDKPWIPWDGPDKLAAKATSADGVDLWYDPLMRDRIFVSDRLRSAIEATPLKAPGLALQEAKVITYS